jgi:hypothetical protein
MKKLSKIFLLILFLVCIIQLFYFSIGYIDFLKSKSQSTPKNRNEELKNQVNKYTSDSNTIKSIQKNHWYKKAQSTEHNDSVPIYLSAALKEVTDSLKIKK